MKRRRRRREGERDDARWVGPCSGQSTSNWRGSEQKLKYSDHLELPAQGYVINKNQYS